MLTNAVVLSVILMLVLSIFKVNVVVALCISAVVAGLCGGLDMMSTIHAFESGLGQGANLALSYALLGAFAVAISHSGITCLISKKIISRLGKNANDSITTIVKYTLLLIIVLMAVASQNILPIHIAFIPILVPPLLHLMCKLKIDRRMIACCLTFGLVTTYMVLPVGFGGIFLNKILAVQLVNSGVDHSYIIKQNDAKVVVPSRAELDAEIAKEVAKLPSEAEKLQKAVSLETEIVAKAISRKIPSSMLLPALGMLFGLLVAIFISYRKPREYDESIILDAESEEENELNYAHIAIAFIAVVATLAVQLATDSMIFGALLGFMIFSFTGVLRKQGSLSVFTQGMQMMAGIGFIMIAANGFATVIKQTGQVPKLVEAISTIIGSSKPFAAFLMLAVGLLVTMGIGSSFSTIPIIATIYVPLAIKCGFSIPATIALVGTAAALGDAGSPASDSTLGPTAGLNVDGQHDHIWDSVVPTFLHYNIPLLIFGWIAAMVL